MHSRIKSITLMLMKWANKLAYLLVLLAIVFPTFATTGVAYGSAGCPGGCTPAPPSSIGAFVYPEGFKDQLLQDVKSNKKDDTTFFQSDIAVYIKNPGSVPGGQPIEAAYNQPRSEANSNDRYSFGISYDCTASGISDQDLTPSTPHWTISYIVDQQLSQNFDNDDQISGSAYYNHIVASPSAGGKSVGSSSSGAISSHLGAPASCFPYTTGNIRLDNFNKLSPAQQAAYPANAATIAAYAPTPSASDSENKCEANDSAGNFGWLLCPAIDLANSTIQTLVNQVIIPELTISPLTAGNGDEYRVWGSIRTLADVLFVLIFMVIIFANTLQFELNAYTIKKVIPKLVAAAILVQFSFIISAIIIDIGNILGQGIASLVNVVVTHPNATPPHGSAANPLLYGLGAAFDTALLIGAVATIGVPTIVLAVLSGLISVIGVVFTLVARQLIIIMLVVLSPLAFAAFVLPNTDRYFSMWLKMFIRISLMYPLIILLLNVAAIGQNASTGTSLAALLAIIFPIIAFFMIPMTFKWAGSAMSLAADRINRVSSGVNSSGAMKGLRTNARERQQRINQNRASGFQGTVFGQNVPGARRVMTGLGRVGTGKLGTSSRTQSDIALATQKAMNDESKRIDSLNLDRSVLQGLAVGKPQDARGKALTGAALDAYNTHSSVAKTLTGQAAVANQMAKKGDVEGLEAFRQHLNTQVSQHGLDPNQATQVWNGAKAGGFSEIRSRDPIMAMSGWANSDYAGPALQSKVSMLKGEDIAGMMPSRLQEYSKNGATITAGQLASATTDKMREGKSKTQQDALLGMAHNGANATNMDVQREHLMRFDYSSGDAVARSDSQVRAMKRAYAESDKNSSSSYAAKLDRVVADIIKKDAPPATTPLPPVKPSKK